MSSHRVSYSHSYSASPLTITPTDMTGASPDITQLASLLVDSSSINTEGVSISTDNSYSLNTDSRTSTTCTSATPDGNHSKICETNDLKHQQKVLISLKNLEEIPAPDTSTTAAITRADKKSISLTKPLNSYTSSSNDRNDSIAMKTNLDSTPNNTPLTSNTSLSSSSQDNCAKIGRDWSHDQVSHDHSSTASSVTSSSSVGDHSKLLELKNKQPEVIICSRLNKATSPRMQSKITTPCTLNDEGLKLEHLVDEGYRVLKEVKRHKERAEMTWNLEHIHLFENSGQDTTTGLPSKKSTQFKTTLIDKAQSKETNEVKCEIKTTTTAAPSQYTVPLPPPDLIPKPDPHLVYQYMVTGQPPVFAIPVQVQIPPDPISVIPTIEQLHQQSAPVLTPVDKASTVDIGIQIDDATQDIHVGNNGKAISNRKNKEPQLVLEVLPAIHITDQLNDSTASNFIPYMESSEDSLSNDEINSTSHSLSISPSLSHRTSNPLTTQTIGVQTHPEQSPLQQQQYHTSCGPHPLRYHVTSSEDISKKMQNRIHKQAQEWTRRELTARVLARVCDLQDNHNTESELQEPTDPDVIGIIKEELLKQAKLMLIKVDSEENEFDQPEDDVAGHDDDNNEYSFTFESEEDEGTGNAPLLLPTPQLTPTHSQSPLLNSNEVDSNPAITNLVPTPLPSPVIIRDNTDSDGAASVILDNVPTPETSPCSPSSPKHTIHVCNTEPINTPTLSCNNESSNLEDIEQSQENVKQPSTVQNNLILSLTETTPTSSPASYLTDPPLSTCMSDSSTDHEISYGERLTQQHQWKMNISKYASKYDQNLSISEGEVPLPLKWRGDTRVPLHLTLLEDSSACHRKRNPISKSCFVVDNSQATSIGEIKKLETTSTDNNNLPLTNESNCNTNKTLSTDDDKDTLADIPSFSELDTSSVASFKQQDNGNVVNQHLLHNIHVDSPGEVSPSKITTKTDGECVSLSLGEVPVSGLGNIHHYDQEVRSSTADHSYSTMSVNEIRNGIEVINISSKSHSSVTYDRPYLSTSRKSVIHISTEPPQVMGNRTLSNTDNVLLPIASGGDGMKHTGPVMLIDDSDNKDLTSCSFTLSSFTTPN